MKITISKKYLVFPVNTSLCKKRLSILSGDKEVYVFDIKLDNVSPDFYAYIDMERFKGEELELAVLPDMSITFRESDVMDIENAYREAKRPQIHFTAKNGWINDPNGLVYHDGVYHMFFQHNPCGTEWGNMHWGHAVSNDLFHWTETDIALFPDESGMMFSGSALADSENILGFKSRNSEPVILFYTATNPYSQHIAYSSDGLQTIHKFSDNPVLPHIVGNNRDPKVVYCDELEKYVMALYLEDDVYAIFASVNFTSWELLQKIRIPGENECPDIFPINNQNGNRKWILMGARDRYIVGEFKDCRFNITDEVKPLHFGKSAYAGQSFTGIRDGRQIRIAWDRSDYGSGFAKGQMLTPSELTLAEQDGVNYLCIRPVREIEKLIKASKTCKDVYINEILDGSFDLSPGPHLIKIKGSCSSESNLKFSIFGHAFEVRTGDRAVFMKDKTAPLCDGDTFEITVITDTSSVELYCGDGKAYMSFTDSFSDYNLSRLEILSDKEYTFASIEINELKSVWSD